MILSFYNLSMSVEQFFQLLIPDFLYVWLAVLLFCQLLILDFLYVWLAVLLFGFFNLCFLLLF
jgi:hypothetical protein